MNKLKLLIDFDNTIVDFTERFIEKFKFHFHKTPDVLDCMLYNSYSLYDLYKNQFNKEEFEKAALYVMDDPNFYHDIRITELGYELIDYLETEDGKDKFFTHIHTKSHSLNNLKSKINWFQDNVHFDKYTFDIGTCGDISKDAKYNKYDIIIDDNQEICQQSLLLYPESKVLIVEYPYNEGWIRNSKLMKYRFQSVNKDNLIKTLKEI